MQPTRAEARRIVVSVCVFWLSFVVMAPTFEEAKTPAPYFVVVFFGAMFAGTYFYWNVYKVAARELNRSIWSFFGPFGRGGGYLRRAKEDYRVLFKIVDPRWWHRRVATATGWPVLLVDAVVLGSLILATGWFLPAIMRAPSG